MMKKDSRCRKDCQKINPWVKKSEDAAQKISFNQQSDHETKIPYGLSNFKEIITEGYLYIDKTAYINT